MPAFGPLRVRGGGGGGGRRLRQVVWRQRRALAAGLALTAAVLGATGPGGGGTVPSGPAAYGAGARSGAGEVPERARRPGRQVSAPVRIADAGAVRLLRPGDHVDVIAAGRAGPGSESGTGARVLAKGALVREVPPSPAEGGTQDGALIVLSVPRDTATALAGAAVSSPLAVTLC
ncbi:hypothetical protein ACFU6R_27470 [Streptomyces sp. NPDC057499]|uniref:hypothetical protein n=1 Tax=Streptomyces sp. NPDC057499 TaxID=3346150 RepID=UPI0036B19593